jgi:NAD(P)-dependent dehydrogenase (short-subunit alcohol dehydrogenase family)
VDVTDAASIHQLKEAISQTTSTLDQVIYSAGVLKGLGPVTAAGLDGLKENITVNLFGAYASAMEFFPSWRGPLMLKRYSHSLAVALDPSLLSRRTLTCIIRSSGQPG